MNKSKKITSIILIIAILLLHTAAMVSATTGSFNVTLPNLRGEVTLGKGTKSNNNLYTKVKVTGGNVNYVYVSVYYKGNNILEDEEVMLTRADDATYVNLWYDDSHEHVKKGKEVTVKGYQKNVLAKTASGKIVY